MCKKSKYENTKSILYINTKKKTLTMRQNKNHPSSPWLAERTDT